MVPAYYTVFATLIFSLVMFIWGKVRHDFIALIALFILIIAGIIQPEDAFVGFSHPAVITVAAVLVLSKGLEYSGLIDLLGKWVMQVSNNMVTQIVLLSALVIVASAFINNVGALAVTMPIAIHMARTTGYSPSYILLPIAFAAHFGGMSTLIGTPPNIIIANFRGGAVGEPFRLFDFAPVGVGLSIVGLAFISFGWRLVPKRMAKKSASELFSINDYITEVRVLKDSKINNLKVDDLDKVSRVGISVLGIIRKGRKIPVPEPHEVFLEDDVIMVKTDAEHLKAFLDDTKVALNGTRKLKAKKKVKLEIREAVVVHGSELVGETTSCAKIRTRFRLNLLAVSRSGKNIFHRLNHIKFQPGDVLLLQGPIHIIEESIVRMGCLPLAPRNLRIGYKTRIPITLAIFIAGLILVVADIFPTEVAFPMAAGALLFVGILPRREVYRSIDWPVIVLLGAFIPVGQALETSGGAAILGNVIADLSDGIATWVLLVLLLTITMFLSDVVNNAATAVLMSPIAISAANKLDYSIDPFLMTVAVGSSCAFLTPIGHQSNTLVLGPGGYKFGDYWRLGLPLEILIVIVGIPLILLVWPV
ncbi:SLC13 family permease [Cytophagaceae bacterium ABcell3]|nr:SLC13 family permease [Cytophagaceae bacterium ABcell3]